MSEVVLLSSIRDGRRVVNLHSELPEYREPIYQPVRAFADDPATAPVSAPLRVFKRQAARLFDGRAVYVEHGWVYEARVVRLCSLLDPLERIDAENQAELWSIVRRWAQPPGFVVETQNIDVPADAEEVAAQLRRRCARVLVRGYGPEPKSVRWFA